MEENNIVKYVEFQRIIESNKKELEDDILFDALKYIEIARENEDQRDAFFGPEFYRYFILSRATFLSKCLNIDINIVENDLMKIGKGCRLLLKQSVKDSSGVPVSIYLHIFGYVDNFIMNIIKGEDK